MKHFNLVEFSCHCRSPKCDAAPMQGVFLEVLDQVHEVLGETMVVTSGARCRLYNRTVHGKADSQHLYGLAADIFTPNATYARRLLKVALDHGLTVGVGVNFLHLDKRPGEPKAFGYTS